MAGFVNASFYKCLPVTPGCRLMGTLLAVRSAATNQFQLLLVNPSNHLLLSAKAIPTSCLKQKCGFEAKLFVKHILEALREPIEPYVEGICR